VKGTVGAPICYDLGNQGFEISCSHHLLDDLCTAAAMNVLKDRLITYGVVKLNRRGISHTVVMLRHGESIWNVEKRFTGWCDIALTEHGEADALDAGTLMGERGMKFDVAFTSTLERAWKTCDIALKAAGQSDTVEKILNWRRSYATAPPSLYDRKFAEDMGIEAFARRSTTLMNPRFLDTRMMHRSVTSRSDNDPYMDEIGSDFPYPSSESLKQCEDRAYTYWMDVIAPRVKVVTT
jgi:2,3-bisphosphoglycerate-dependent phosphoglycerate mutase